MPWKATSVMDERLRFVARLLDGEAMTDVCRSYGISRKTGYKIFNRYKEHGLEALTDRSRRPVRYANQLPDQIEGLIVRLKREKPHWGARKLRELLVRRLPGDVRIPANSTIHAVLDRHGLVKTRGRPRRRATGTPLSDATTPNALWCVDFKGEFKLGNGQYCYPLTVTDQASRFLLMCEALSSIREELAFTAFERLFAERGLPQAIRSDNGVPFASPNGLYNLSKLSVWWLRLGIAIERIKPGKPQQNGRHERMHLTLKKEATRPPGMNLLQQQARFDSFVEEFNTERPHEALAMKWPAEIYTPSQIKYRGLPDVEFLYSEKRDIRTAKRFFKSAIARNGRPEKVTLDRYYANHAALVALDTEQRLATGRETPLKPIIVETGRYKNNRIEQHHRRIKKRIKPMLGFKSKACAAIILGGIEMVQMMRQGQATYAQNPSPNLKQQFEMLAKVA